MLPDGFIVKNNPGNVVLHRLAGAKQQFAIIATIGFAGHHPDRVEAALDGTGTFIGGEKTFAFCHHCLRDLGQLIGIHSRPLQF
jgi:hypothetical protein